MSMSANLPPGSYYMDYEKHLLFDVMNPKNQGGDEYTSRAMSEVARPGAPFQKDMYRFLFQNQGNKMGHFESLENYQWIGKLTNYALESLKFLAPHDRAIFSPMAPEKRDGAKMYTGETILGVGTGYNSGVGQYGDSHWEGYTVDGVKARFAEGIGKFFPNVDFMASAGVRNHVYIASNKVAESKTDFDETKDHFCLDPNAKKDETLDAGVKDAATGEFGSGKSATGASFGPWKVGGEPIFSPYYIEDRDKGISAFLEGQGKMLTVRTGNYSSPNGRINATIDKGTVRVILKGDGTYSVGPKPVPVTLNPNGTYSPTGSYQSRTLTGSIKNGVFTPGAGTSTVTVTFSGNRYTLGDGLKLNASYTTEFTPTAITTEEPLTESYSVCRQLADISGDFMELIDKTLKLYEPGSASMKAALGSAYSSFTSGYAYAGGYRDIAVNRLYKNMENYVVNSRVYGVGGEKAKMLHRLGLIMGLCESRRRFTLAMNTFMGVHDGQNAEGGKVTIWDDPEQGKDADWYNRMLLKIFAIHMHPLYNNMAGIFGAGEGISTLYGAWGPAGYEMRRWLLTGNETVSSKGDGNDLNVYFAETFDNVKDVLFPGEEGKVRTAMAVLAEFGEVDPKTPSKTSFPAGNVFPKGFAAASTNNTDLEAYRGPAELYNGTYYDTPCQLMGANGSGGYQNNNGFPNEWEAAYNYVIKQDTANWGVHNVSYPIAAYKFMLITYMGEQSLNNMWMTNYKHKWEDYRGEVTKKTEEYIQMDVDSKKADAKKKQQQKQEEKKAIQKANDRMQQLRMAAMKKKKQNQS